MQDKAHLRSVYLNQRAKTSPKRKQEIDEIITNAVLQNKYYQAAECVFIYIATKEEIETKEIITDAWKNGKTVCIPRCAPHGMMTVHQITSFEKLTRSSFGILEPQENALMMEQEKIDLAIVPALACDESGYRLGYGGGYYDRFLSETKAAAICLCAEERLVSRLPKEKHDVPCDVVVTERREIHTK